MKKKNKTIIFDGGELGKIKITKERVDKIRLENNIRIVGDLRTKNPPMRKSYKDEDCITPSELWNEVVDGKWFSDGISTLKEKMMNSIEWGIISLLREEIGFNTKHLRIDEMLEYDGREK